MANSERNPRQSAKARTESQKKYELYWRFLPYIEEMAKRMNVTGFRFFPGVGDPSRGAFSLVPINQTGYASVLISSTLEAWPEDIQRHEVVRELLRCQFSICDNLENNMDRDAFDWFSHEFGSRVAATAATWALSLPLPSQILMPEAAQPEGEL